MRMRGCFCQVDRSGMHPRRTQSQDRRGKVTLPELTPGAETRERSRRRVGDIVIVPAPPSIAAVRSRNCERFSTGTSAVVDITTLKLRVTKPNHAPPFRAYPLYHG
jgi:hypothetical protein